MISLYIKPTPTRPWQVVRVEGTNTTQMLMYDLSFEEWLEEQDQSQIAEIVILNSELSPAEQEYAKRIAERLSANYDINIEV